MNSAGESRPHGAPVRTMALPPALVLAAGDSSRFWPLSTHCHKSMVRLCGKPVLEHTLRSLAVAGVTEAIIVQSPAPRLGDWPYLTPEEYFGDGTAIGLKLSYVVQSQALGQGDAISLAAKFLPERYFIVQPENINAGEIVSELWRVGSGDVADVVAVQKRQETWLFGVLDVKDSRVQGIVEKPAAGQEPSKLCIMGVYLLGQGYLSLLERESKHPFPNLGALTALSQQGGLAICEITAPFFPLKYPWHLLAMRDYLFSRQTANVHPGARIEPGARLEGNVVVEEGASVAASAIVKGPAYIGKNVTIDEFTILRPGCVIEENATLRPYTDLFNSLVGVGTRIHRSYLANSILGENIWTDANLSATNTRVGGGEVTVDVKGHTIATQLQKLGAVIGHGSRFGVNVTLLPGVMVGSDCSISAGSVITENVADSTRA